MSMFSILDTAASALSAQSVRLNTTASNLANAESVAGSAEETYRARHAFFEAVAHGDNETPAMVQVSGIVESEAPASQRYEPGHPLADAEGYVYSSNVDAVEEMVNMISASRSYQNNVEVMVTARDLMLQTLQLGK